MACYLHSTYNVATVKKLRSEMKIFWQTFCTLGLFMRAELQFGRFWLSHPSGSMISENAPNSANSAPPLKQGTRDFSALAPDGLPPA